MVDFNGVEIASDRIREAILRLRSKQLSYSHIGKLLGIDKGSVYRIEQQSWQPKKKQTQEKILARVQELAL